MSLFFANILGWIVGNWRLVAAALGLVALVTVFGLVMRSCNKPPKLDEKEIQKAQTAIAKQDREAMVEILAKSEVIEKQIDANLANAETKKLNALAESRKKAAQLSNEELAAELERRIQE